MKDGKISGTGNSWAMKSVPNARLLYPTHEILLDALESGSFFVDLLRNPPGWEEEGDLLGKEILLKDVTAGLYGLGPDAVPDEVLEKIHKKFLQISSGGSVVNAPIGCIMAWSRKASRVPDGWHICDGTNGTVDLRDKFILGAGNAHPAGSNGGSEEVTLTVEQMPAHNHDVKLNSGTSYPVPESKLAFIKGEFGQISSAMLFDAGGNLPHDNMPPYYALYFIQKIAQSPTDFVTEADVDSKIDELLGGGPWLPAKKIEWIYPPLSDDGLNINESWGGCKFGLTADGIVFFTVALRANDDALISGIRQVLTLPEGYRPGGDMAGFGFDQSGTRTISGWTLDRTGILYIRPIVGTSIKYCNLYGSFPSKGA